MCGEYSRRNQISAGRVRFIPTCVGNTCRSHLGSRRCPVHPHVCGEYLCARSSRHHHNGSSPRVWGIRNAAGLADQDLRFIPTCVGNTRSDTVLLHVYAVHPHVCGEYAASLSSEPFMTVHPHVCGEYVAAFLLAPPEIRFIPTCVGNTHTVRRSLPRSPRFIPTCVGNTQYPRSAQ